MPLTRICWFDCASATAGTHSNPIASVRINLRTMDQAPVGDLRGVGKLRMRLAGARRRPLSAGRPQFRARPPEGSHIITVNTATRTAIDASTIAPALLIMFQLGHRREAALCPAVTSAGNCRSAPVAVEHQILGQPERAYTLTRQCWSVCARRPIWSAGTRHRGNVGLESKQEIGMLCLVKCNQQD